MNEIHGTTNRVIDPRALAWAAEHLLPRVATTDAQNRTRWHGRFVDALKHLAANPVRCEIQPDGRYHAAFRSSRDVLVEYYADEQSCTCQGFYGHRAKNPETGRTELVAGYCWHRAAVMLLPHIDRWEKHQLRKAFRIRYAGGAFTLLYHGEPVAGVTFDLFDEAVEHVAHQIERAFS